VESGPRKLVKQVLTVTTLLGAVAIYAQSENATGSITVNGRQFSLRYVYASVQPGFFDRQTEDIRVLLTDVPVADPVRGDVFALARLAREGQLHGIEVVLDEKGEPLSGFLFLDAFDGLASVSGAHRFQSKALERLRIAGRLFTDAPRTFSGVTWEYDVSFTAAIMRPPTAEESAAALKSEPALAAAAHLQAIQVGFEAFLATLTETAAASFRLPDGRARFEEVRAETPPDSRVVSLSDDPDGSRVATVQAVRHDGVIVEFFLRVRREGTGWRVERAGK
jgi:hypothetical protein